MDQILGLETKSYIVHYKRCPCIVGCRGVVQLGGGGSRFGFSRLVNDKILNQLSNTHFSIKTFHIYFEPKLVISMSTKKKK